MLIIIAWPGLKWSPWALRNAACESENITTLKYKYSFEIPRLKGFPPFIVIFKASLIPYNSASKTSFVRLNGHNFCCHSWPFFYTIPALIVSVFNLEPSDHRIKSVEVTYAFSASFFTVSVEDIMISPEKTKPLSCITLSKLSEEFIRSLNVRFFVNLYLIALELSFKLIHCKL